MLSFLYGLTLTSIHDYWKNYRAMTRQTFVGKVMSLLFNMLSKSESEVTQLCPTLCDSMDCSLLGSSVHGILQARILEWVTISFARGSSRLRDRTQVYMHCKQILYLLSHQGSSWVLKSRGKYLLPPVVKKIE